jgi:hypothetical protein
MPTTQKGNSTPKGEILRNSRPYGPWAGNTVLSAPTGPGIPHVGLAPRRLIQISRASDIDAVSRPAREMWQSNRCQSLTRVGRQILVSAQRRVNEICHWIELCLNGTLLVAYGAIMGSKEGEYFLLLFLHPKSQDQ